MRFLKTLAVLLLAIVMMSAGAPEDDVIRIGVAGAHTGDLASFGLPAVNAAQLVIDQVNEDGGLLGRRVELVIEDDQCADAIAPNTAARLVDQGVVAVIGHICSGATRTALGTYLEAGIVAISPSATSPTLTQSGEYPNFFRTIAPDDAQAALQVEFILDRLDSSRIAVLHDQGQYGQGLADFARGYLEESGEAEIVLYDGVTPGAVDYSAIVNRIEQSGADTVVYGGYHPEASKIVAQMRQRGMEQLFVSGDGVKDDTFIDVAGVDAEGVYATSPQDVSSNALEMQAREAHVDRYGEAPGPFFSNAYAATLAIVHAIEEAGSTEYEAIRAALQTSPVETPLGSIRFDERGDAIGVGFSMFQVVNGEYVEVQ